MNTLVQIQFHGNIWHGLNKKEYKLAVKSVGEAIHAVNSLNNRCLYPLLLDNDKKGVKYKVLINGRGFLYSEPPTVDNIESIKNSELVMNIHGLKSIDIVPVIEGGDSDIGTIVFGALLIIAGVVVTFYGGYLGPILIMAGIGLLAAGVINLLSPPPKFEDFREIGGGGRLSYLFNGPQNTTQEGGPVPVGYGRLIVGSHVIAASYEVSHQTAKDSTLTV